MYLTTDIWSCFDINLARFDEDMHEKRLLHFSPSDLDLLTSNFLPLVTVFQCHVSTELEVSTAFQFRENRMHRPDRHIGLD